MDYFTYKNGTYYCEDVSLEAIAKKYGTPVYVYSEKTIEKHCLRFKEAFSSYPNTLCSFAVKACSNLSILKNNKAKAVRLETLDAICKALDCPPGDILEYVDSQEEEYGNKQQ